MIEHILPGFIAHNILVQGLYPNTQFLQMFPKPVLWLSFSMFSQFLDEFVSMLQS